MLLMVWQWWCKNGDVCFFFCYDVDGVNWTGEGGTENGMVSVVSVLSLMVC